MKQKLVPLLILFIISLFVPKLSFAQDSSLMLVVTEYETRDDIDFLFENSTRVLEYLEGVDVDRPLFLSLISPEQKEIYIKNGFNPEIIDENADIERFVLLYNPRPDQSEKLKPYGEPIIISSHYTLLKMTVGAEFTHEGESGRFFDIPFSQIISSPPLRTKTATELTPAPIQEGALPGQAQWIIIGVIVLVVIIILTIFILWYRKKKNIII